MAEKEAVSEEDKKEFFYLSKTFYRQEDKFLKILDRMVKEALECKGFEQMIGKALDSLYKKEGGVHDIRFDLDYQRMSGIVGVNAPGTIGYSAAFNIQKQQPTYKMCGIGNTKPLEGLERVFERLGFAKGNVKPRRQATQEIETPKGFSKFMEGIEWLAGTLSCHEMLERLFFRTAKEVCKEVLGQDLQVRFARFESVYEAVLSKKDHDIAVMAIIVPSTGAYVTRRPLYEKEALEIGKMLGLREEKEIGQYGV